MANHHHKADMDNHRRRTERLLIAHQRRQR
jgi:hypothetical protein